MNVFHSVRGLQMMRGGLVRAMPMVVAGLLAMVPWPTGGGQAQTMLGRGSSVDAQGWPSEVPQMLSSGDAQRYRRLFAQARAGQAGDAQVVRALEDSSLLPHVQAARYLSNDYAVGYDDLSYWLAKNRDLPEARALYQLAETRRPAAPTRCETVTKKVKVEVKKKGHKKPQTQTKTVKERQCKVVGARPALPPIPRVLERQQERKAALEAAREAEYAGMDPVRAQRRRQILGEVWQERARSQYDAAVATLTAPGARQVVGDGRWQEEMVKSATWFFGKKNYARTRQVAMTAASVAGPERDTALWLAGMSAYRLQDVREAANLWEKLALEEPVRGPYYARGAYWGARAARELGENQRAQRLLQRARQDEISFYGQLASAQLGGRPRLDFGAPAVRKDDVRQLMQQPAVRRAVALAQVGEVGLAQDEIKVAYSDLPYQSSRSLVALAVRLQMPGTALHVAKDLQQRGEIVPAALFPMPDRWHPQGPALVERQLMVAIMRQESAFQPTVGSRVGAQGLMQLMPATAKYIAQIAGRPSPDRQDLHDPTVNLTLAQDYLNYLNQKLNGNMILVIAAYNGGIGNVQRWLARGVTPSDDPLLFIESIPFDETKDYVEKVMANLWLYQDRAGKEAASRTALAQGFWPLKYAANEGGGVGRIQQVVLNLRGAPKDG